jgi:hypothetical protein
MKYSTIILAFVASLVAGQTAPKPKVIRAPCGTSCILPILKSSKCEAARESLVRSQRIDKLTHPVAVAAAAHWLDQAPAAKAKPTPEHIAAVRECFCRAPGLQEAFAACVPAACAKTHGKTTTLVGRFNAMCAKTQGFQTIPVPAPIAAAPVAAAPVAAAPPA